MSDEIVELGNDGKSSSVLASIQEVLGSRFGMRRIDRATPFDSGPLYKMLAQVFGGCGTNIAAATETHAGIHSGSMEVGLQTDFRSSRCVG